MLRTIAQYLAAYGLGHALRPYVLALFDTLVAKLRSKLAAKLAPVVLLALLAAPMLAHAQVYNKFGPAAGVLKGSTSTYQTTAAASSDIISLWSGTCDSTTFLRADGQCQPAGGGGSSPLTTKGDLYTYSTMNDRLPVGSNGLVLMANSGYATGLTWWDPAAWGYIDASYANANYAPKLIGRSFVSSTFNDGDTVNQSYGAFNTIKLSGDLATLTLEFNAAQPGGAIIRGSIDHAVTTVTWVFAGSSAVGTPPVSLVAGDSWAYIYDDFNNLWWPFK
jgi:hypothetical protein